MTDKVRVVGAEEVAQGRWLREGGAVEVARGGGSVSVLLMVRLVVRS